MKEKKLKENCKNCKWYSEVHHECCMLYCINEDGRYNDDKKTTRKL